MIKVTRSTKGARMMDDLLPLLVVEKAIKDVEGGE